MSTQLNLNIKKPCLENFNSFILTKNGGFCNSCEKEVVDFTNMNSKEVQSYFKKNKAKNTCGRFYSSQLSISRNSKIGFFGWLSVAFLSVFSINKSLAQETKTKLNISNDNPSKFQSVLHQKNVTVSGIVKDDTNFPLPGVTVILEGTTTGTQTDFDGSFEFPEKLKKGDVLIFSYVGMNSKKVIIDNKASKLDISLEVNMKFDACILMGKVATKKVYKSKK